MNKETIHIENLSIGYPGKGDVKVVADGICAAASVEDPRRMEKNVFYIQINSMGQKVDIPLNAVRNLSQEEQKVLVDSMYTPIDDAQAEEIMNS